MSERRWLIRNIPSGAILRDGRGERIRFTSPTEAQRFINIKLVRHLWEVVEDKEGHDDNTRT